MDPTRVDLLARSLWQPHSRRRVLGVFAMSLGGAPPVAAAPQPAHHRASSAKRRCRSKGGRYFGPGACPCAATCAAPATRFPCPISPQCSCFASATGGAICGDDSFSEFPTACATNADCIKLLGNAAPLCVLMACIHPDGQPCGPGQPPCPGGGAQVCLSGRCRYTGCVKACG